MDKVTEEFKNALLASDRAAAKAVLLPLAGNQSSISLVDSLIVPVLEEIGEGWLNGRYALSQIYMSGKIVEELVDEVFPQGCLKKKDHPKIAIVVLEDYHFLGKRIVYSILRASGYEVKDYGHKNVDELIQKVRKDKIKILLISVLMLSSAIKVKELADKLKDMSEYVKIIVGGAPFRFDAELWKEVNADAMGSSASESQELVERMIGEVV